MLLVAGAGEGRLRPPPPAGGAVEFLAGGAGYPGEVGERALPAPARVAQWLIWGLWIPGLAGWRAASAERLAVRR